MEKTVSGCLPDNEGADNNAQETPAKAAPEEQKQEPQPPKPSPAFACLQTSDGPIFVRKSSVVIFRLLDTTINSVHIKKSTVPITIVNGNGGLSSFDYHINDKSHFDKFVEEMNS
jgi:hypothetical protein